MTLLFCFQTPNWKRSLSLVSFLGKGAECCLSDSGAHGYSVFFGRFVPSPPFTYLIAYYITDSWVFIAFSYHCDLFRCSYCFSFGRWEVFQCDSRLWHVPFHLLSRSLLSATAFSCTFPVPALEQAISLALSFLVLENGI